MALVIAPTVTRHYDLTAATLAEVVGLFPDEDEVGSCTWEFPYPAYEYDAVGRNGKPRGLRVHMTIKIELPRWVGRNSAAAAERTEWDRFLTALRQHERGHETRARTGARALHNRMADTRVNDLATVFEEEQAKIQATSDAYDTASDHGRKPPPGTIITVP
jgi:predicted secreted Zn-dependent protease